MLDKLARALATIKQDLESLRTAVSNLENADLRGADGANGRDGRDGKDGHSPDPDAISAQVISSLKDEIEASAELVTEKVLSRVPLPKDGRDAPPANHTDIANIVLSKIRTPKDGKDGPELNDVVRAVSKRVKDGKQGPRGLPGKDGKQGPRGLPGKDGVSITDVILKNNELFVFLDGKKKKVGKIKVPLLSAPFIPDTGGGGATRKDDPTLIETDKDYITKSDELIICTNTSGITVTLNDKAGNLEKVTVKMASYGPVTVDGGGKLIDGKTEVVIGTQYYALTFIYTTVTGSWSII